MSLLVGWPFPIHIVISVFHKQTELHSLSLRELLTQTDKKQKKILTMVPSCPWAVIQVFGFQQQC